MIKEITMFTVICDNCREDSNEGGEYSCWNEAEAALEMAKESGWIEEGGKHYCEKCWLHDDDDNIAINKERYKEPKTYSRPECVFNYCPTPIICKEKNKCINS